MSRSFLHSLKNIAGKHGQDTRIRFSVAPLPGDSGFRQWHDAMMMCARLPGGIPQEFRRRLWLTLAEKHLQARGVSWPHAESFCFNEWSNPDDDELGDQIVKDLHRTGCSLFCGEQAEDNQAMLKRVLLAFARWNKGVGYCQGFNMLAAIILEVMERQESDALKVMIYLIEGVLPESYFANNLRGLSVDMAVFRDLLRLHLPHLSRHLEHLQHDAADLTTGTIYEPPLTNVFTMQWFLTLFSNCLPRDTVMRVWDLTFLQGNEVLLRTALAIWDGLARRILEVHSADEFYTVMGVLTREMLSTGLMDANKLVQTVVGMTPFPFPGLAELRDKYTYNITPWTQSVSSVAKRGLRLFYSDDDDDENDEDDQTIAVATAFGLSGIFRKSAEINRGSSPVGGVGGGGGGPVMSPSGFNPMSIAPSRHAHEGREITRPNLDISALKKQYARLRERQKQAHIILTASQQRVSSTLGGSGVGGTGVGGQRATPLTMNHLLRGKKALTSKTKRVVPQGVIPVMKPKKKAERKLSDSSSNRPLPQQQQQQPLKPCARTLGPPACSPNQTLKHPLPAYEVPPKVETLHWKDTPRRDRRASLPSGVKFLENSSPSSSLGILGVAEEMDDEGDGGSSTSTELCDDDDDDKLSDLEPDVMAEPRPATTSPRLETVKEDGKASPDTTKGKALTETKVNVPLDTKESIVVETQVVVLVDTKDSNVMETNGSVLAGRKGSVLAETKGSVLAETKGNVLAETNGSVLAETNGSVLAESKGSVLAETNGSVLAETNGSVLAETNGSVLAESKGSVLAEDQKIKPASYSYSPPAMDNQGSVLASSPPLSLSTLTAESQEIRDTDNQNSQPSSQVQQPSDKLPLGSEMFLGTITSAPEGLTLPKPDDGSVLHLPGTRTSAKEMENEEAPLWDLKTGIPLEDLLAKKNLTAAEIIARIPFPSDVSFMKDSPDTASKINRNLTHQKAEGTGSPFSTLHNVTPERSPVDSPVLRMPSPVTVLHDPSLPMKASPCTSPTKSLSFSSSPSPRESPTNKASKSPTIVSPTASPTETQGPLGIITWSLVGLPPISSSDILQEISLIPPKSPKITVEDDKSNIFEIYEGYSGTLGEEDLHEITEETLEVTDMPEEGLLKRHLIHTSFSMDEIVTTGIKGDIFAPDSDSDLEERIREQFGQVAAQVSDESECVVDLRETVSRDTLPGENTIDGVPLVECSTDNTVLTQRLTSLLSDSEWELKIVDEKLETLIPEVLTSKSGYLCLNKTTEEAAEESETENIDQNIVATELVSGTSSSAAEPPVGKVNELLSGTLSAAEPPIDEECELVLKTSSADSPVKSSILTSVPVTGVSPVGKENELVFRTPSTTAESPLKSSILTLFPDAISPQVDQENELVLTTLSPTESPVKCSFMTSIPGTSLSPVDREKELLALGTSPTAAESPVKGISPTITGTSSWLSVMCMSVCKDANLSPSSTSCSHPIMTNTIISEDQNQIISMSPGMDVLPVFSSVFNITNTTLSSAQLESPHETSTPKDQEGKKAPEPFVCGLESVTEKDRSITEPLTLLGLSSVSCVSPTTVTRTSPVLLPSSVSQVYPEGRLSELQSVCLQSDELSNFRKQLNVSLNISPGEREDVVPLFRVDEDKYGKTFKGLDLSTSLSSEEPSSLFSNEKISSINFSVFDHIFPSKSISSVEETSSASSTTSISSQVDGASTICFAVSGISSRRTSPPTDTSVTFSLLTSQDIRCSLANSDLTASLPSTLFPKETLTGVISNDLSNLDASDHQVKVTLQENGQATFIETCSAEKYTDSRSSSTLSDFTVERVLPMPSLEERISAILGTSTKLPVLVTECDSKVTEEPLTGLSRGVLFSWQQKAAQCVEQEEEEKEQQQEEEKVKESELNKVEEKEEEKKEESVVEEEDEEKKGKLENKKKEIEMHGKMEEKEVGEEKKKDEEENGTVRKDKEEEEEEEEETEEARSSSSSIQPFMVPSWEEEQVSSFPIIPLERDSSLSASLEGRLSLFTRYEEEEADTSEMSEGKETKCSEDNDNEAETETDFFNGKDLSSEAIRQRLWRGVKSLSLDADVSLDPDVFCFLIEQSSKHCRRKTKDGERRTMPKRRNSEVALQELVKENTEIIERILKQKSLESSTLRRSNAAQSTEDGETETPSARGFNKHTGHSGMSTFMKLLREKSESEASPDSEPHKTSLLSMPPSTLELQGGTPNSDYKFSSSSKSSKISPLCLKSFLPEKKCIDRKEENATVISPAQPVKSIYKEGNFAVSSLTSPTSKRKETSPLQPVKSVLKKEENITELSPESSTQSIAEKEVQSPTRPTKFVFRKEETIPALSPTSPVWSIKSTCKKEESGPLVLSPLSPTQPITFNPFPTRNVPRQPKEITVKLGLYSPSKKTTSPS